MSQRKQVQEGENLLEKKPTLWNSSTHKYFLTTMTSMSAVENNPSRDRLDKMIQHIISTTSYCNSVVPARCCNGAQTQLYIWPDTSYWSSPTGYNSALFAGYVYERQVILSSCLRLLTDFYEFSFRITNTGNKICRMTPTKNSKINFYVFKLMFHRIYFLC